MARYSRLLTDAQWEKIQPLLPKRPPNAGRFIIAGWILRSGARWQDLPEEFPSPATSWRRLRDWKQQEIWLQICDAFLAELNERQQLK
jgi:transposase